jgi:hypothetical protein
MRYLLLALVLTTGIGCNETKKSGSTIGTRLGKARFNAMVIMKKGECEYWVNSSPSTFSVVHNGECPNHSK